MTILIVTDSPLFEVGLQAIIKSEFSEAQILQTNTLKSSIALSAGKPVHMMLLDASVDDGKDTNLLKAFKQSSKALVMVHLGDELVYIYPFIRAGANGLLSKKCTSAEICEGIKKVSKNLPFVSSEIQQLLLSHITSDKVIASQGLTKKESQLAELIATTKTRNEIAAIAGINPQTVTTYKRKIFQKLMVNNILELNIKLKKLTVLR
ncbi:response regulator transcription factor [Dyadobacter aurulentus]|uniref:response regulator transcription factor n=1 Tax=Dyadobacter sp. UC 10 TaxID=2605428 RepID=UPI0011F32A17|nr:response regulator transcription factor [Dyadobacter sp. UC 10]KAA0993380.1 response regulator transcription factor [Dyadobacter sp. UC 10]